MPSNNQHITQLIIKHLQETITVEEADTLQEWIDADEQHRRRFERLTNSDVLANELREYEESDQRIQQQVYTQLPEVQDALTATPVKRMWVRWLSVAAAAIILISVGTWYWQGRSKKASTETVQTPIVIPNDIQPGQYKAKLTLDDGSVVSVDSFFNGKLVQQGGTIVYNKNGQLVYKDQGKSEKTLYNTLSTAKGQMYGTVLGDGTKVWLNSQSSIRYPVSFGSDFRKVEISGEVYFEVAPSIAVLANEQKVKRPFIVNATGMEIEVLGTHFDVNSYADEDAIKTTLVEGKVKVHSSANNAQAMLAPGEQAKFIKQSQSLIKTKDIDVDAEVAWRFGYFNFNNADLKTVMRQLERWYDVQVEYHGNISDFELLGKLKRSLSLSQVLSILQVQNVNFKIEGKKIIVSPKQ